MYRINTNYLYLDTHGSLQFPGVLVMTFDRRLSFGSNHKFPGVQMYAHANSPRDETKKKKKKENSDLGGKERKNKRKTAAILPCRSLSSDCKGPVTN